MRSPTHSSNTKTTQLRSLSSQCPQRKSRALRYKLRSHMDRIA
ncbi:MAG: hypothetical protein ACKPCM_12980 [Pseudanabaena sp.]